MAQEIITPDRKGLRKAALEVGIAIALLFGVVFPWLLGRNWPRWPWIVAGVLIVLGLAVPNALGPAYRVWMRFAALLHRITSPIILGVMFFVVIWPFGLAMRLFGSDPLRRKRAADAVSYRVPSEPIQSDNLRETLLVIDFLRDLWQFMRVRKKFWMAPILLIMLLLGVLLIVAKGSALAPFIYTLF